MGSLEEPKKRGQRSKSETVRTWGGHERNYRAFLILDQFLFRTSQPEDVRRNPRHAYFELLALLLHFKENPIASFEDSNVSWSYFGAFRSLRTLFSAMHMANWQHVKSGIKEPPVENPERTLTVSDETNELLVRALFTPDIREALGKAIFRAQNALYCVDEHAKPLHGGFVLLQLEHLVKEVTTVIQPIVEKLEKDNPLTLVADEVTESQRIYIKCFYLTKGREQSPKSDTKILRKNLRKYLIQRGYAKSEIPALSTISLGISAVDDFLQNSTILTPSNGDYLWFVRPVFIDWYIELLYNWLNPGKTLYAQGNFAVTKAIVQRQRQLLDEYRNSSNN